MVHCRCADALPVCRQGENLATIRHRLEAARHQLVIFPVCVLSGYCFQSKAEAWPLAEAIPGPSTLALADDCREFGVWAVVGMLEARPSDGGMFNACAIGPGGVAQAVYRKIHLPCLGADRFTTRATAPSPSTTSAGCGSA